MPFTPPLYAGGLYTPPDAFAGASGVPGTFYNPSDYVGGGYSPGVYFDAGAAVPVIVGIDRIWLLLLTDTLPAAAISLVGAISNAYSIAGMPAIYGKLYTRRTQASEPPPNVILSVKKGGWFYHSKDTKIRDYQCSFKVRSLTGQAAYEGAKALSSIFPDDSHLEWAGGYTGPLYQNEWSDDAEMKLGSGNSTVHTATFSFCARVVGVR